MQEVRGLSCKDRWGARNSRRVRSKKIQIMAWAMTDENSVCQGQSARRGERGRTKHRPARQECKDRV